MFYLRFAFSVDPMAIRGYHMTIPLASSIYRWIFDELNHPAIGYSHVFPISGHLHKPPYSHNDHNDNNDCSNIPIIASMDNDNDKNIW
jgi:hypothetical protein